VRSPPVRHRRCAGLCDPRWRNDSRSRRRDGNQFGNQGWRCRRRRARGAGAGPAGGAPGQRGCPVHAVVGWSHARCTEVTSACGPHSLARGRHDDGAGSGICFRNSARNTPRFPPSIPRRSWAQLSFHPARSRADLLTRAPKILPRLVSVSEFRRSEEKVLFPSDLVVGLRDRHLYLAVAATGLHVELLAPTAINFGWNNYTPPLARFLAEISRA
jgi:Lantibiotic dehydratase, N terminus